jgi:hypothetical protein
MYVSEKREHMGERLRIASFTIEFILLCF